MPDRQIINIDDSVDQLRTNLKDTMRGVISSTPSSGFNHNWVHKNEGKLYAVAVSENITTSTYLDISFKDLTLLELADSFATIPLSEEGHNALIDFTTNSIVGSLNSLKDMQQFWEKVVIDSNRDFLIPQNYLLYSEYINVDAGLIDFNSTINNPIKIGDINNTSLDVFYVGKTSLIGCFNKLADIKNNMVASRIADQYMIVGSATVIFNNEEEDTDTAYNPATGIYTVPYEGMYFVSCNLFVENEDNDSNIFAYIYLNTYAVKSMSSKLYLPLSVALFGIVKAYIGDTFKIVVDNDSGNGIHIKDDTRTNFKIYRKYIE